MSVEKVIFCLFCSLIMMMKNFPATYSLKNKDKPCVQFSTCKCIYPTGRGINLTPISQNLSVQVHPNASIYIHLCDDISFGKIENNTINQCFQNASVCYVDSTKNESLTLGKSENMKIISVSQFEPMSLLFDNTENKTNIALICDEEAVNPKLTFKPTIGNVFNLELQSKYACVEAFTAAEGPPGVMSTGSVLVIMLLVFTLVYFGGGMIALKLLRGAEGREMIPNVDFWMDLPYLVRDGVLFTLNRFRPADTYDRI